MCACASSAADDGQGKTHLLGAAANTFDGLFLTAGDSTEMDSLATSGCPGQLLWRRPVCVRRLGRHWSGCSGWWAKVTGAARSRSTWPSSLPTSRAPPPGAISR